MSKSWLHHFVIESNRIEGIELDNPRVDEYERFLDSKGLVGDLETFVGQLAPGHTLRDRPGLDVRVGAYAAPAGGPEIRNLLEALISDPFKMTPYQLHCAFENLHPFTDGNGRSGRVLWLWRIIHGDDNYELQRVRHLGFLHTFYYQALDAYDGRKEFK